MPYFGRIGAISVNMYIIPNNNGSGRKESVAAGCSESENSIRTGKKSFDFNHALFFFRLSFQKFRNPYLEDTILDTRLNVVFFCIFG